MDVTSTSNVALRETAPLGAPASMRVRVKVSDPTRAIQLRDYFRRLGLLCTLAGGSGTVEAECSSGPDRERITREELGVYLDGWAKTNRIRVRLA